VENAFRAKIAALLANVGPVGFDYAMSVFYVVWKRTDPAEDRRRCADILREMEREGRIVCEYDISGIPRRVSPRA
jgi:hypothetical protein